MRQEQPYLIDIVSDLLKEVVKLRKAVEAANKQDKQRKKNANDQQTEKPKEKIDEPH